MTARRHFLGAGISKKLVPSASLLNTDNGPGRAVVNQTTMAQKSRIQSNAALQQPDALPKQTYTRAMFLSQACPLQQICRFGVRKSSRWMLVGELCCPLLRAACVRRQHLCSLSSDPCLWIGMSGLLSVCVAMAPHLPGSIWNSQRRQPTLTAGKKKKKRPRLVWSNSAENEQMCGVRLILRHWAAVQGHCDWSLTGVEALVQETREVPGFELTMTPKEYSSATSCRS